MILAGYDVRQILFRKEDNIFNPTGRNTVVSRIVQTYSGWCARAMEGKASRWSAPIYRCSGKKPLAFSDM